MSPPTRGWKGWARLIALITPWAAGLFGTGAYWQYSRLALDQERQEWDRLESIATARESLNDILLEAHRIKATLDSIKACDPMQEDRRVQFAADDLETRLEVLTDDFGVIEERLAVIEGRTPRATNEWYFGYANRPPGPPVAVTVSVVDAGDLVIVEDGEPPRQEPTPPCPSL